MDILSCPVCGLVKCKEGDKNTEGRDPYKYKNCGCSQIQYYREAIKRSKKPYFPTEISIAFVRKNLKANELGDGILFTVIHRGQLGFSVLENVWKWWDGCSWRRDPGMARSLVAVENVVDCYLSGAVHIEHDLSQALAAGTSKGYIIECCDLREEFYERVKRLRSESGRLACLKFARTNRDSLAFF